ncbi:hypothetical protein L218DRAFT_835465, partial [Marasmius fiardii PR-910]
SRSFYSRSHSLGDSYTFDPRDGWRSVNVSDMSYKYRRDLQPSLQIEPKASSKSHTEALLDPLSVKPGEHFRITGDSEPVTITWYTGEDLKNPSCWLQSVWAPTDKSFVCAVTLEGWTDKPQCFKFLELCNGPDKCVFVRVVDTCAGCEKGSRHVDLTKAAFAALADLDTGRLEDVQMRPASQLP